MNKKVLVGVLDWGLGHATRTIPVVQELLKQGCQVELAANGPQQEILREAFPNLVFHEPPAYHIRYADTGKKLVWGLLMEVPRIVKVIKHEQQWITELANRISFDLIISDNRYGFYHPAIPSVIISHQLSPKTGLGKLADYFARIIHFTFLSRFNACWVPDTPQIPGLSGDLSHPDKLPKNIAYIGVLSRFDPPAPNQDRHSHASPYLLLVMSGPEPARTDFEQLLRSQIHHSPLPCKVVRGLPGRPDEQELSAPQTSLTALLNHADSQTLQSLISRADLVICRSGYSSIMDLVRLHARAVLVPTPGQTEQEYLARHLDKNGIYPHMEQSTFDLHKAWEKSQNFPYRHLQTDQNLLSKAVETQLKSLY